MVQNYRDLLVWQKAMDLAEAVCLATEAFPKAQQYILVSQMQRSAISVPSNIAEGRSRHSERDFIYHLNIARGSLAELETQVYLSMRLKFLDENKGNSLLLLSNEITKMLFGLRSSLSESDKPVPLKAVT
ncbi:MAG: four helix bundle protein [Rickettsiales bacterium]|nr:four helix bundle protein [Rickettsiales bacterium]